MGSLERSGIWPEAKGWAIVLYTALFPSLRGANLFIKGVEEIGPNRAGLFINLIPVFGTFLSVMIMTLHLYQIIALLLALGGIAVRGRTKKAACRVGHKGATTGGSRS